jgi:hypothetical protein
MSNRMFGRFGAPDDAPMNRDGRHTARRRKSTIGLGVAVVLVALGALGYALTATFAIAASTTTETAPASSGRTSPQATPADVAAPSTGAAAPTAAPVAENNATADSGPGCAQRAMAAARFNPACGEYQGYLDPGRSAGRGPTSGEIQHAYGCAQGYIPKSQC